jgi:membrane associated rhomboid family serine protease
MGLHDRDYSRADKHARFDWGGSALTAVTTLIILNVAVFVIDALGPIGPRGGGWLMRQLSLDPGELWKIWTFLTYGFAHSSLNSLEGPGLWHIAFNMLGLFVFGVPVEQRIGKAEFLRFYLLAVIVSGLVWVISVAATGSAPLLGASGAVAAVVVLMALYFPFRELLLLGILPLPVWSLATFYVLYDLYGAIFSQTAQVAFVAHLGGAAFAAAYFWFGWNFAWMGQLKTFVPQRKPKLRVHQPSAQERLQDDADKVLEKIHRLGEASLTSRERKTLERYSAQMRDKRKADH